MKAELKGCQVLAAFFRVPGLGEAALAAFNVKHLAEHFT